MASDASECSVCAARRDEWTREGASHKSGTHRLLCDYKQAEGWNVLALSNGRWKLPDDRFGAFLEHYVSDLPRYKLGLVVKKSEYFPYIMDVDKSATKGTSVGSPMEVFQVVVQALNSVIGETKMLFKHPNCANFQGSQGPPTSRRQEPQECLQGFGPAGGRSRAQRVR